MEFPDALQAVLDGYRSRAAELLPAYFLSPAVAQVARVVAMAGLAVAYAFLSVTGRLARFRADLRAAPEPPGPEAGFDAYDRWFEAVLPAFERLVTPEVVGILAVTLVLTLAVWTVLYAVATAAQLGCCWAIMRDERGTTAAIRAAGRYWGPLLGLLLLQLLLAGLLTVTAFAPVLGLATVSPVAAVFLAFALGFVWLLALVVLRAVFAFAAVAVVVEDVGVAAGLRGAVAFARRNAAVVLGYLVAVLGLYVLVGSVAASGGAGSAAVSGLMGLVVASPTLDLLKTALYGDDVATVTPPDAPEASAFQQARAGLHGGLAAMRAFVARHPGLHVLAAALLVAGAVGGWLLAAPYEGLVTASIDARLATHSPRTAVVAFTTNNVGVAVSTAFSGLALGVPAGVSLVFNGALLGVLGRLEVAPVVLVAFVVPHGVIELPAFVIAGALGFSLGADAWRARRGRLDRRGLADALERGFRVLVGVAVLLAVAGLLEGLVSPYYFRPFLG